MYLREYLEKGNWKQFEDPTQNVVLAHKSIIQIVVRSKTMWTISVYDYQ